MTEEVIKIFSAMSKDDFTTDEEARMYIENIFKGYVKRKRNGSLYNKDGIIPEILIGAYYTYVNRMDINEVFGNFKRKYIYNENQLEEVHKLKERQGLSRVYDYLQDMNEYSNTNVYSIFKIHQILYSLIDPPVPEFDSVLTEPINTEPRFGGVLRNSPAHLEGSPIELVSSEYIPKELGKLFIGSTELTKRGLILREKPDPVEILKYIDDCIKLKCALVKIHPFGDGNGRSARALLNLYFKLANIPPVYVKKSEKEEYQDAMGKAICDEEYNPDFTSINRFYYYKLCDSIVELDIDQKEKSNQK